MQADDFSGKIVRGRTDLFTSLDDFNGGPEAHLKGAFTDVADWPLGAIHAVLLPLGNVLTYGTAPDEHGVHRNSSGFVYDVWNPLLGLSPVSHTTLDILTPTNIFCSGQVVLPGSGNVLITGGDQYQLPGGTVNDSINHVNLFNPLTNDLTLMPETMAYPRWYPTVTTLPSGEQLVQGGRLSQDKPSDETGVTTPEIYNPVTGWRTLDGATSQELWGYGWYYPRAFVTPSGKVLSFKDYRKEIFLIDPKGTGSVEKVKRHDTILTAQDMPALMYRPGKIMTIYNQHAFIVDVSASDTPLITETQPLIDQRHDSDATLLLDGSILLSGGSRGDQVLDLAVFPVDIWSPDTGVWQRGASAQKERFYHSSALLLPNGTVLTAGGGPPGPVANINAEIYYPPYLFKKDGSGELANRPEITQMGSPVYGESFSVSVSDGTQINAVAAIRTGSVTHSFDQAQRYIPLEFEQQGNEISIASPIDNKTAPPGQYMLVLIDTLGVPSNGEIFQLNNPLSPRLVSHQQGEELTSDTATFHWKTVVGAMRYRIQVGSKEGAADHGQYTTTATQRTFRRLPSNGIPLHIQLQALVNGSWHKTKYTLLATEWPELKINSHTAGETLSNSHALFTWPAIPGASKYVLRLGNSAGGRDIRSAGSGISTQLALRHLPTDGREMYATLMFQTAERYWRFGPTVQLKTVNWPILKISSHIQSEVLTSDFAKFSWPHMPTAQRYHIRLGSEPGGRDLGARSTTDQTDATIRHLPTDGRDVYVTVQFQNSDGRWHRGPSVVVQAATAPQFGLLSQPAEISPTTRFEWQPMPHATAYQLRFGGQKKNYDFARIRQTTETSVQVAGLPQDKIVHLRLMYTDGNYWRSKYYSWPASQQ